MHFTVYREATGEILRNGTAGTEADCLIQAFNEGERVYLGETRRDQRIVDGQPVDAPDLQREAAKSAAVQQIEVERQIRTELPIVYADVTLDADKVAQANISAKLQEIAQRTSLGLDMQAELLIWRDFYNEVHTFDDMTAYQAWLAGLAIAITERGTRLYVWAWEKKAQLAACTTLSEIQALDLS